MSSSLLEPSPGNKFGVIKLQTNQAKEKGINANLFSIGEPNAPAYEIACAATAKAIMSRDPTVHGYQDNGTPGCPDFARRFIMSHPGNREILEACGDEISYIEIPGIKPIIDYVIKSLGAWESSTKSRIVATTPGYPTPKDQAIMAANVAQVDLPSFSADQGFLPTMDQIHGLCLSAGDLIMLNLPNNPTGAVADKKWLEELCGYCEDTEIRLFNDAAYAMLKYDSSIPNLAQVAPGFKNLNWMEAYSSSKIGNFCGWRVGGIVGSTPTVNDFAKIKGNSDSGLNAALAIGILELVENHMDVIDKTVALYKKRLDIMTKILTSCGFKIAVEPKGTFFSLWHTPQFAFGQGIEDSEQFNELMLNHLGKEGIVGVPFDEYGDKFIRYAVCAYPIEENIGKLTNLFEAAGVEL